MQDNSEQTMAKSQIKLTMVSRSRAQAKVFILKREWRVLAIRI
jgi:hypothetical protein